MAIQTVKRWGNSLAVRIPASLAEEVALQEGQEVDVVVEDGRLQVRPHTAIRRFSLERLIQQHEEGKLAPHETIDWGDPVGNETGGPDDPDRNDNW